MRRGAWAWVVVLSCGCGETTGDVVRASTPPVDGGGGQTAATGGASQAGRSNTGGSAASGGSSMGGGSSDGGSGNGTGGGSGVTNGTGGSSAHDASVDGPSAHDANLDAPPNIPDGGCAPLPRDTPDTSQYCTAELCRKGSGWVIVVNDPRGFYVGHLFWLLSIGDQKFIETYYVGVGTNGLAFAITESEYAGLKKGEGLYAFYGNVPPVDSGSYARGKYCGDFR